jgi:hypothetical protein
MQINADLRSMKKHEAYFFLCGGFRSLICEISSLMDLSHAGVSQGSFHEFKLI